MAKFTVKLADIGVPNNNVTVEAAGIITDEHWIRFDGSDQDNSLDIVAAFPTSRVLYVIKEGADGD